MTMDHCARNEDCRDEYHDSDGHEYDDDSGSLTHLYILGVIEILFAIMSTLYMISILSGTVCGCGCCKGSSSRANSETVTPQKNSNSIRFGLLGILIGLYGVFFGLTFCVTIDAEELGPGKGPGCILAVTLMGGFIFHILGVSNVILAVFFIAGYRDCCCGGQRRRDGVNGRGQVPENGLNDAERGGCLTLCCGAAIGRGVVDNRVQGHGHQHVQMQMQSPQQQPAQQ